MIAFRSGLNQVVFSYQGLSYYNSQVESTKPAAPQQRRGINIREVIIADAAAGPSGNT